MRRRGVGGCGNAGFVGFRVGGIRFGIIGVVGFGGSGREEIVVVAVHGVADGLAPAVGAEGVDVFVLGEVDGLQERLHHVGDGAG